jgi:hypothetical protein
VLFRYEVFESDPTSCAQAVLRLFTAAQEARVMLETYSNQSCSDLKPINTPAVCRDG